MARAVQTSLPRMTHRMTGLARAWPKATALLLGLVSATGFAPLGLWPLTLVALALLILQIAEAPTQRRVFGLGWAFGVGHFALGLNWIATAFTYQAAMPAWLGWIAVALLSLYLAIYPALAAWGAWAIHKRQLPTHDSPHYLRHPREGGDPADADATSDQPEMDSRLRGNDEIGRPDLFPLIFAFAATWIITEWLRSWVLTGFAWNPLSAITVAGSFASLLGAHLAQFVGTYGTSAIVILLAGWVLMVVQTEMAQRKRIHPVPSDPDSITTDPFPETADGFAYGLILTIIPLTVLIGLLGYIFPREWAEPKTRITVVQPNVGQQDKWVGEKADANFAKLARLTKPLGSEPRLILWPEAAIPDYLEAGYPWVYYERSPAEARARLTALMNPGDLMLLGALKLETDKAGEVVGARNAVMMVRSDGSLGPRYDKSHLVPYGEYLPMRPILSALGLSRLAPGDLDFWPGPGPRTLDLGRFGKAGIQICYEIIFSGQVVDRASRPDFIFNPSNDAWFGSWGPPQHLAQARLRAIEEGLPVIRSTPTGISAVIDADGRVLASLPMHRAGRIDTTLPPPHAPTLFARFGNMLPLAFAALLLALAIATGRRRR